MRHAPVSHLPQAFWVPVLPKVDFPLPFPRDHYRWPGWQGPGVGRGFVHARDEREGERGESERMKVWGRGETGGAKRKVEEKKAFVKLKGRAHQMALGKESVLQAGVIGNRS